MKRKITIEDDLQERVNDACEEVKQLLLDFLEDNQDTDETPCISNDLNYSGGVNEIVDSNTPIYYYNLDSLWFLYKDKLIEAYDNTGVGDDPTEKNGAVAIYCYLEQKVNQWYADNADDIFTEWELNRKKDQKGQDNSRAG